MANSRTQPRLQDILWGSQDTQITSSAVPRNLEMVPGTKPESLAAQLQPSNRLPNVTTRSRLKPVKELLNDFDDGSLDGHSTALIERARRRSLNEHVTLPPICSDPRCLTSNTTELSKVSERKGKSGAPLAKVLNSASPQIAPKSGVATQVSDKNCLAHGTRDASRPREHGRSGSMVLGKRKRNSGDSNRILPKPAPKASRRRKQAALLPPLLAPLHNPPVDARIVPSMNHDGFMGSMPKLGASRSHPASNCAGRENTGTSKQATIANERRQETEGTLAVVEPQASGGVQEAGDAEGSAAQLLHDNSGDKDNHVVEEASEGRKARRPPSKRIKWDKEETQCLIEGVARFGIGYWKRILECEDFHFYEGRNSVDLKDRFRTCFPDEYRKSGSQRGKLDSRIDSSGKRRGRGGRTTVELEKMGVGSDHAPFPKQGRRQRNAFTDEEDAALLRGFMKYPAQWKRIRADPELGLEHRTRTDLRDRFRNRYPQRFKEAGYVHKAKQPSPPLDAELTNEKLHFGTASIPVPRANEDIDLSNLLISSSQPVPSSSDRTNVAGGKDDSMHMAGFLTRGYDYSRGSLDDDDASDDASSVAASGIHLNRAIFEWADQNKRNADAALVQAAATCSNDLNFLRIDPILIDVQPSTLSSVDQHEIMAPERLPSLAALMGDASAPSSASLSLSRILNEF